MFFFFFFFFFKFSRTNLRGGTSSGPKYGDECQMGDFCQMGVPQAKAKTPWGVFNLDDIGFYDGKSQNVMSSLQQLSGPLCIVEFGGLMYHKVVLNHAHCVVVSILPL